MTEKILIIEDDLNIAELERDFLKMNGYSCRIETDGTIGCAAALSGEYSLVIIDIMLPGKDGFQICDEIRRKLDIPLIMLSARTEDIDKVRALGLGADDYMTKPFSPNELVARVKAHLSRYKNLKNSGIVINKNKILDIRELSIDKEDRRVFKNNKEIILTTKEFELLLFLIENPNRVFSKDLLFDRIWGFDAVGDISTVTVHVQRLRDKIEATTKKPQYIETVWGAGYRFKL